MTEKILKPDAPITQEQLLRAIKDLLKQQELEREGLKKIESRSEEVEVSEAL